MITQNRLIFHFKKRETALKWLVAAFVYAAFFAFMENPMYSTISIIGRHHHILFSIYCFLFGAAMLINIQYGFKAFKYESPLLNKVAYFFNLSMGLVVTTVLGPKAAPDDISLFATIVHWIFGFGGIVADATIVLILCLNVYKQTKSKKVKALFITGTTVAILDLLAFVGLTAIMKDPQKSKNGIFEIVPIFVTFAVLYLLNHTDIAFSRKERDADELSVSVADNSTYTAVSYGFLASAWLLFTTFIFTRSPIHYTISMTGLDYFGGYALTCALLAVSFTLNFIQMFKKHNYKNYFVIILSIISSLSLVLCIVQPTTMEKDIDAVHAVAAMFFFCATMASMILYIFSRVKQNKKYKPFLFVLIGTLAAMLLTVLVMFVILDQRYGRTGLTELIPLEVMFGFFYLENYTDYFAIADKKEKVYAI